jgi:Spy/CpxP family protein refolding chaperone
MKKLIIAALLVVSISSFAQEQEGDKKANRPKKEKMSPEQRNQAMLDKLTKDLSLTPQQQEQIKPILADQSSKMEAMRTERMGGNAKEMTPEERDAFRAKRQEERKAVEAKYKTILTPEQFKKMKESEESGRDRMREGRGNGERRERENGDGGNRNDN